MKAVLKINLLLIPILLMGCKKSATTSLHSSQTNISVEQSSSSSSKTISTTSHTVKLDTSGSEFGLLFPPGTQFSLVNQKEQNEKLVNYLNGQSDDHELISSIDCESCVSQFENKKDASGSTSHLTLGTQKSIGIFTINFKYEIKEIKVNAQVYFSYYEDYQNPGSYIYNVDVGAKLKIENQEFELEAEAGKLTIPVDKTVTLESPKKLVSLGNVEADFHRIFVNSIEVTYYS